MAKHFHARWRFLGAVAAVALTGGAAGGAWAQSTAATGEVVLPKPPQPFAGKIGATYRDSIPAAADAVKAPAGAPNVLLVLTDDVAFGAASTFGGPVPTPNLDRLAKAGLVYNRFHTTAMCSPTRASLLTGRNHHAVGNGAVTDFAMGYPGYTGVIPKSAATVAETLRLNGYSTAMFGKHHNVQPGAASAAGPFDQWPTGLGFDYFYGFIGAETNQFTPALYRGTTPVAAPAGEVLDHVLISDAIRWVHNHEAADPDRPFFLYVAPGTAHAPQQAPRDWIAKFRGKFDQGWDAVRAQSLTRQKALGVVPRDTAMTPRPAYIPEWNSISADRRQVMARMMEVYAGMLAYQDDQFGRLVAELERMGKLDNTLIIFIEGDNGASAESGVDGNVNTLGSFFNGAQESTAELVARLDDLGGPNSNENYPAGWAWAVSAPLQWTKTYASHLGGTRNGLVMSWPAGIRERGLRTQFHHVIDIAPTILEAAKLPQPTIVNGARQQRMDGVSMAYSFAAPKAPGQRRTQYFELVANRGIYHDGWWAGTTPQHVGYAGPGAPQKMPEDWPWELYNIDKDFSQAHDLAASHPAKLAEMKALFQQEAARNNVLPVDDRVAERAAAVMNAVKPRDAYVYWGNDVSVTVDRAPRFVGSFSLSADIDTSAGEAEGVLAALGGHFAGWSFYLKDGRPTVVMAGSNQPARTFRVAGNRAVPAGRSNVRFDFVADDARPGSGGMMTISVDGQPAGQGRIERPMVMTTELSDMFDVGFDGSTTVTDDYAGDGRFKGVIHKIEVRKPVAGQ